MTETCLPEARCRLYKFISAMLCYPDVDVVAELPQRWNLLWDSAHFIHENLADRVQECREASQTLKFQDLCAAFIASFGVSPRGSITPYECEYGDKEIFQFASDLADINAFYTVFGVKPDGQERGDHIATECEFMAFLCAKELRALLEGKNSELQIVRDAQKKFFKEHLARWSLAFSRQLHTANPAGPHGAVAGLLEALTLSECAHFGIQTGSTYIPLRQVAGADDPSNYMSCGKQEGLPGAEAPVEE